MSTIKSFAIGSGDMYYIRHGSDNFTIIDCSIPDERAGDILTELARESKDKGISRFISTHPDQDHLGGLVLLDDTLPIINFYTVQNSATKETQTEDFKRYCELRDSDKAFNLYRDCSRRWMNKHSDERGSAGLSVRWPVLTDVDYQAALEQAAEGGSPNNLSIVLRYSLNDGPSFTWMGDLETDFMEKIQDRVSLEKTNILFAPHHGRISGKVPPKWLEDLDPDLIIIGEAPSEYLDYYAGRNIITQNSCGDILFDCTDGKAHIYVSYNAYSTGNKFLDDEMLDRKDGLYYLGTLPV